MNVSQNADAIVREIRELREERQRRLECDMHFIDAEYDRRLRRLQAGSAGGPSLWSCSVTNPVCLRRRCRRGMRRLRWRLTRGHGRTTG